MKKLLIIFFVVVSVLGLAKAAYADGPYEKLPSGSGVQYRTDTNAVCSDEKTVTSIIGNRKIDDCNKYDDPDGNPIVCANDNGVVGCYIKKSAPTPVSGSTKTTDYVKDGVCKDDGKIYNQDGAKLRTCPDNASCVYGTIGGSNGVFCADVNGPVLSRKGGWYCGKDELLVGFLNNEREIKRNTKLGFIDIGSESILCNQGAICKTEGEDVKCAKGQPVTAPSQEGESGAAAPGGAGTQAPINLEPKGDVNVARDGLVTTFYWAGPANAVRYRLIIDSEDDKRKDGSESNCPADFQNKYRVCQQDLPHLANNGRNVAGGVAVWYATNFNEDGATYTWWVDALDANGNTIGTSDGFQITVHKTTAAGDGAAKSGTQPAVRPPAQPAAPVVVPPPAPRCGGTCIYSQRDADGVIRCYAGNCRDKSQNCSFNTNCGYDDQCTVIKLVNCPGTTSPVAPGATPAQGAPAATTCKGETKAWAQIDAELKGANYDGAFDHSQAELDAYNRAACPAAGAPGIGATAPQAPPARTTTKYRLATNPIDLEKATWYDYTAGGVTVNIPSPQFSLGVPNLNTTQSIYVQFMDNNLQKIKFDGGLDHKVVNIDFVDYATIPPAGAGGSSAAVSCTSTTMASGNGNPGGNGAVQLRYSGTPAKVKVWMASNSDVGKNASQVSSWTSVADTTASSYVSFSIPQDMVSGYHAVLVSLHDETGSMLDGNPAGVVNSNCTSSINIQSAESGTPAAGGSTQCISVSDSIVSRGGSAGISIDYNGNPTYTQVWLAQNSDIGKSASDVQNWTKVRDYSAAYKGLVGFNVPPELELGNHAILVALFDPRLSMLDGNPGGVVNPKCASTLTIK